MPDEKTKPNPDWFNSLSDEEKEDLRELLENYRHSKWLTLFVLKVAQWVAGIVAGIVAYKVVLNGGVPLK